MTTYSYTKGIGRMLCMILAWLSISSVCAQADCNNPIIGKNVVVDQLNVGLASLIAITGDYENVIDGNLNNYVSITGLDQTGLGGTSLVSVKNVRNTYPAGRRVGFVIESQGGLLSADIINALVINTYLDDNLQESADVGGGGPLVSLSVLGQSGGKRRVSFVTTLNFDEVELQLSGTASSSLTSPLRIYYAYEEDPNCDYNCITTLTTNNYAAATVSTNTLGGFTSSSNVIDANLSNSAFRTFLLAGSAYIDIDIKQDIPAGYDVGFAIEQNGLLGLISLSVLQNITITTYNDGTVQQAVTANSNLVNAGILTAGINLVSFKTSQIFDRVRINFNIPLSLLNTYRVYYGFVRPDDDNDGLPNCVDRCLTGNDNLDADADGIPDACDTPCTIAPMLNPAICVDETTAQLPAAAPGQTWSALPGNPSPATIDNTGLVTGLSAPGIYQFQLSDGNCSVTVSVNYTESTGNSQCTDPIAGPSAAIGNQANCELCSNPNINNIIDGDLSNYVENSNFLSIILGGSAAPLVSVKDNGQTYGVGTRTGFVVSFPTGLLTADLLSAFQIRTYLNGTLVETSGINGANILGADALGGNQQQRITFEPTQDYNEVELVALNGIVGVQLLSSIRIFYAFTEPTTCPSNTGLGIDPNAICETPLLSTAALCGMINYERTSISGIGSVGITMDMLGHLVDDDLSSYATVDLLASAIGEASISMKLPYSVPGGSEAGYLISIDGSLLGVGALSNFTLTTYLNGTQQESYGSNSPLVSLSLLGGGSNLNYLSFTTQSAFDEIQLTIDANLAGINLLGGQIKVYYAYYSLDSDGDGTPDCRDKCCRGSDYLDSDGNGVPNACEGYPNAVDDVANANTNTATNIYVLNNDDFGTDGPGSISILTPPTNGMAVINDNGTPADPSDDYIIYTSNAGFTGTDAFQYQICDGNNTCDMATVTVTVNNQSPQANDDINNTLLNTSVSGNVLTNDSDPNNSPLTVNTTPIVSPSNGTVMLNADGSYTYMPNNGFVGTDQFTYQVCNASNFCDNAVVTINVFDNTSGNNPPVAHNDQAETLAGVPVSGNVLNNDVDPDGDMLTVNTTPGTPPANGMVTLNADGTFTYTPTSPTFTGTDQFTYTVCDGNGGCDMATVFITVGTNDAINNDPPFAQDDAYQTFINTSVNGNVLNNDSDPDNTNNELTVSTVQGPSDGMLTLNSDGTFTYTPNTGFLGTDQFIYQVCDPSNACDVATVYITTNSDRAPIAKDDINNTLLNTPVDGNVLTNDYDPNGLALTVNTTPVSSPTNGAVTLNANGSYTYTPNNGFLGTDQFNYQVCNTEGFCDTALVTINVFDNGTGNDAPVAHNDIAETLTDVPVTGNVLDNDVDPDGDMLTVNTTPVTPPTNGSVTLMPDGSFTYTPNAGFTGTDQFTYQVCDPSNACDQATVFVTVGTDNNGNANNPPYAQDDAYQTFINTPTAGNVLDNDSDPDNANNELTVSTVQTPSYGTLMLNSDGTFIYMPNTGFLGTDQFTYQVCDPSNACDVATVYITSVSDRAPIAQNDINNTLLNTPTTGNVLTNDYDPNGSPLTVSTTLLEDPMSGMVVIANDGTYTYTPNNGFLGTDQFTYEVCNAEGLCDMATVTVNTFDNPTGNDAPVAHDDIAETLQNIPVDGNVLNNDIDPDGNTLTVNTTPVDAPDHGMVTLMSDGSFTYTPNTDYIGTDQFTYQVCDPSNACDQATVYVTVGTDNNGATNDPPFAEDDAYHTISNSPLTGNVSNNDSDPNGDPLTVNTTPVVAPMNGTLVLNSDGTFTYTPNPDFVGNDQFVYQTCDDNSPTPACDVASVYLTVAADELAPVAKDDINNTLVNTPVNGNVTTNDTDPDGVNLTVNTTPVVQPTSGTVMLNSDGTYTYTPNMGFEGTDQFTYRVCDDDGLCDIAVVTINVFDNMTGNEPPLAHDDVAETLINTAVNGNVLSNDVDPEGNTLTTTLVPASGPTNGTLTLNPSGTFTYTPNNGFTGSDQFTYQVCDPLNACDQATVYITVYPDNNGPANDPPFAQDDAYKTFINTNVNGNVLNNDSDPNGDALTVTQVSNTVNGMLLLNADGTFTYTPNLGFLGTDQFTYQACDGSNLCDVATVYITTVNNPGNPDLTPVIDATPSSIIGIKNINIIVDIIELTGMPTSGLITVRIPKDNRFTFTYNPALTMLGFSSVNNSDWSYDGSNPVFHIFTTNAVIPGYGVSTFGFTGSYNPQSTSGTTNMTVTIQGGSGSEVNTINNSDATTITYFFSN